MRNLIIYMWENFLKIWWFKTTLIMITSMTGLEKDKIIFPLTTIKWVKANQLSKKNKNLKSSKDRILNRKIIISIEIGRIIMEMNRLKILHFHRHYTVKGMPMNNLFFNIKRHLKETLEWTLHLQNHLRQNHNSYSNNHQEPKYILDNQ